MNGSQARATTVASLAAGPLAMVLVVAGLSLALDTQFEGAVWLSRLGSIGALIVGAVLIVAGATKVVDRPLWIRQAKNLGVPTALAAVVPVSELLLGAAMIVGIGWPMIPIAAIAMLSAFTAVIAAKLGGGTRPECACFGGWSTRPIAARDLWRNAGLISLALLSLLR